MLLRNVKSQHADILWLTLCVNERDSKHDEFCFFANRGSLSRKQDKSPSQGFAYHTVIRYNKAKAIACFRWDVVACYMEITTSNRSVYRWTVACFI